MTQRFTYVEARAYLVANLRTGWRIESGHWLARLLPNGDEFWLSLKELDVTKSPGEGAEMARVAVWERTPKERNKKHFAERMTLGEAVRRTNELIANWEPGSEPEPTPSYAAPSQQTLDELRARFR